MKVLAVGGCASGVGKSTWISRLLSALPGWGALKTSPGRAAPGGASWRLTTEIEILAERGSDTRLYLDAGAARVAWLRSPGVAPPDAVAVVREAFQGLAGIVVEGNSVTRVLRPDRIHVLARAGRLEIKGSALPLLETADVVILNRPADRDDAESAATLGALRRHGLKVDPVVADVLDPRDPRCAAILAAIRDWSRC